MTGLIAAAAMIATFHTPDGGADFETMKVVVNSVNVMGNKTVVTCTFTSLSTTPGECPIPDLVNYYSEKGYILIRSNNKESGEIGKLYYNKPRKVTFTYYGKGQKLRIYDKGFRGTSPQKDVVIP